MMGTARSQSSAYHSIQVLRRGLVANLNRPRDGAVTAIGLLIFFTVVTGVWFTWGGIHDIRALFRSLRGYKIDDSDNGTVKEHKPF